MKSHTPRQPLDSASATAYLIAKELVVWQTLALMVASTGVDDEEGDRHVLAADGNECENVEELVISEDGR